MGTKPQRSASVDAIQAQQYAFPYHFIPNPSGHPRFSKSWRFSASYIAALNISRTWLEGCSDLSSGWNHIDIGCGDGAFIYHLSQYPEFSDLSFTGVDFDARAISWARIFNSDRAQFESVDLAEMTEGSFQSASLIEVIEHIPPQELPNFVEHCARVLKPGAQMLVTVPSAERPVDAKHYQHFTFESLQEVFAKDFEIIECFGFEKRSIWVQAYFRLFFSGPILLEISALGKAIVSRFSVKHSVQQACARVGLVARKPL